MKKYIVFGKVFYSGKGYSLTFIEERYSDSPSFRPVGASLKYHGSEIAKWNWGRFDDDNDNIEEIFMKLKKVLK